MLIGSKDPEEVKKEKIDKLSATIEEVKAFVINKFTLRLNQNSVNKASFVLLS